MRFAIATISVSNSGLRNSWESRIVIPTNFSVSVWHVLSIARQCGANPLKYNNHIYYTMRPVMCESGSRFVFKAGFSVLELDSDSKNSWFLALNPNPAQNTSEYRFGFAHHWFRHTEYDAWRAQKEEKAKTPKSPSQKGPINFYKPLLCHPAISLCWWNISNTVVVEKITYNWWQ